MENVNQNSQSCITAEDVWKLFQKTDEQMKETDRRIQETDRIVKETSAQMKETAAQMKENEKKMYEMFAEGRAWSRENQARIKYLDQLYSLHWGQLIEALTEPAALKLFKKAGIKISHAYKEAHKRIKTEHPMEVDVILCNSEDVVAVEVKTTCHIKNVDHFLKQMKYFKENFTEFEGKKVYVAVAGIEFKNNSDAYAQKKGLFVLKTSGEGVFTLAQPEKRKMF